MRRPLVGLDARAAAEDEERAMDADRDMITELQGQLVKCVELSAKDGDTLEDLGRRNAQLWGENQSLRAGIHRLWPRWDGTLASLIPGESSKKEDSKGDTCAVCRHWFGEHEERVWSADTGESAHTYCGQAFHRKQGVRREAEEGRELVKQKVTNDLDPAVARLRLAGSRVKPEVLAALVLWCGGQSTDRLDELLRDAARAITNTLNKPKEG